MVEYSIDVQVDNIEAALQHRMEDADKIETKGTPGFSAVRTILLSSKKLSRVHEQLSKKHEPKYQQNSLFLSKQDWD